MMPDWIGPVNPEARLIGFDGSRPPRLAVRPAAHPGTHDGRSKPQNLTPTGLYHSAGLDHDVLGLVGWNSHRVGSTPHFRAVSLRAARAHREGQLKNDEVYAPIGMTSARADGMCFMHQLPACGSTSCPETARMSPRLSAIHERASSEPANGPRESCTWWLDTRVAHCCASC